MDGWIEVEKGIPVIYNLWHLFVQFWKVRLLARRLDSKPTKDVQDCMR